MKNLKDHPVICGLCPHGCWVRATVSEGRLTSVKADTNPLYGNLCRRGRLAPQVVYSEDRIKSPLIRNGRKGEHAFREATWDEALDFIAAEFKRIKKTFGAEGLASYMGAGTLEDGLSSSFKKFLEPFGSPNDMDCGSVCYVASRIIAPLATMGIQGDSITPDYENSKLIILWGANPFKDGLPDKIQRIKKAREQGAKLIVIDPRRNRMTRDADHWISIIPGTDGALALALINLIIKHGRYDRDFVERWSYGFDELASYASGFSPEAAEKLCGVDAQTIRWLASAIADAPSVAIDFYSGLEYAPSGVQNTRALYSLLALTGNLDSEGGVYIHEYPHKQFNEYRVQGRTPLGSREYPLFHALAGRAHIAGLAAAVLYGDPYPVRGMLIVGGSPYRSYPDPTTWKRVYESLDFLAVVDRFMPEEAAWADVILPAATYYEIESYQTYRNHIRLRHKLIEPVGQAMNDSLILSALAERLGYGDAFPKTEREIVEQAFADTPRLRRHLDEIPEVIDMPVPERRVRKYESGHLRDDGEPGFPTPSGKFEFVSALLEKYGHDSLPVYKDPRRTASAKTNSLMLTTGARSRARFNSQYLDLPELADRNRAVVEINPADAEAKGIQSGEMVALRTSDGEMLLEAHVTDDICEGTVHVPYGGGGRRQVGLWPQASINSIIPPGSKDQISGYPVFKAVPCEVAPVKERTLDKVLEDSGAVAADLPSALHQPPPRATNSATVSCIR